MEIGLSTWTRSGSEKAQASQTIRILMKSLQYLAEDAASDDTRYRSFQNIASAVIKGSFIPATSHGVNEQASVLFNSMGWKNAQIKFSSGNEAQIILGSNRHFDQTPESVPALKLLVGSICKAVGYHILSRDVDAIVDIDIHGGPLYTINIKALKSRTPGETSPVSTRKPQQKEKKSSSVSSPVSQAPLEQQGTGKIDTTQIFLPIISKKLPLSRLHLLLRDVLAEFSQSWYGNNPIADQENLDEMEAVAILIEFLVEKVAESGASQVESGVRVGTFLAHAISQSFSDTQSLDQEIIDGSTVGSIIRDIKARALCSLRPGEKCGPSIGDSNRESCDFAMGIWQGALSELGQNSYTFSGFYQAGKRDPYCLMEFTVD